jgi:predicted type IV restriction endonuclease
MDFIDQIKQLSDRIIKLKDNIQTEEATKNAFIMPFIQCIGYDVFNPLEVVPEYVTDIGTKKGEKIDYAIFKDNQPTILIECKHWAQNLSLHDGQLLRYFHVSKAKFGILTNGIVYRFYTDLVEANKMDEKPFFEFDLTDIKESQVEELKKFHKSYFEIEKIVNTASELKYTNEIKNILNEEFKNPSEAFVKFFVHQVYNGRATEKIILQFTELVKKSANQIISETITERLKNALNKENETNKVAKEAKERELSLEDDKKIETTVEELEAYFIVKSILRKNIDSTRVTYRDAQSYFSIFLDDNNRKPVCRLHFNTAKKYIGIFDVDKKETKFEISNIDEIFKYATQLINTIEIYEKK